VLLSGCWLRIAARTNTSARPRVLGCSHGSSFALFLSLGKGCSSQRTDLFREWLWKTAHHGGHGGAQGFNGLT